MNSKNICEVDDIVISDEGINKIINCNLDMRMIYYDNIGIQAKREELAHLQKVVEEEKAKQKNYKYWINYLELSIALIEPQVKLYDYLHGEFIDMLHQNNVYIPKELMGNVYEFLAP